MPTLARRSSNMSLFRFFSQGITNEFASRTKKDPCSFPMMRYSFRSISSGHLQPDLLLNSMTSPCAKSVLLFLIICCSITSYVIQDCFLNSRSSSRITSPITATKDKDWFTLSGRAHSKQCLSWVCKRYKHTAIVNFNLLLDLSQCVPWKSIAFMSRLQSK